MRITCLITGVPTQESISRCAPSLRTWLSGNDVDYICVMREEFFSAEISAVLKSKLGEHSILVVPSESTTNAIDGCTKKGWNGAPTIIKMWHEVSYGFDFLMQRGQVEGIILRVRYDNFFSKQELKLPSYSSANELWIPSVMRWSGLNDMVCLGTTDAFSKYANVFNLLPSIQSEIRVAIPEALLYRGLTMQNVTVNKLEISFLLYRHELYNNYSEDDLDVIAWRWPSLSAYKLAAKNDNLERRTQHLTLINEIIDKEKGFPLFVNELTDGSNFYPPEIDHRDNSVFRWLGLHGYMTHYIKPNTVCLKFKVHYFVDGWDFEKLLLMINGFPLVLEIDSVDEFGRTLIKAHIPEEIKRAASGNITFASAKLAVPSITGQNPSDHRQLSVAIGVVYCE